LIHHDIPPVLNIIIAKITSIYKRAFGRVWRCASAAQDWPQRFIKAAADAQKGPETAEKELRMRRECETRHDNRAY